MVTPKTISGVTRGGIISSVEYKSFYFKYLHNSVFNLWVFPSDSYEFNFYRVKIKITYFKKSLGFSFLSSYSGKKALYI